MTDEGISTELIVRGVIRRGDEVLLVQSTGSGWWFLPGGHLETGETLSQCLVRELIEEARLEVTELHGLGFIEHSYTDDTGGHHELNVLIQAASVGEVGAVEDDLTFQWFPVSMLAALDVRPEGVAAALRRGGPIGRLVGGNGGI
ncbi:NUDIX domain-containing protein [Actinomyces ruminis]|uniref:NUDIX domain-containing protein n=1 Tax=Actinomyces ruminis TaxID=1937003 RepID=A0ABX4M8K0_9ACTO|nr:NUDIX domain-containing protein [Actinomyces ruminis]PHP51777.1 NUDIX domain-containing protein [Actinomyces ruminis]